GISPSYKTWLYHGESVPMNQSCVPNNENHDDVECIRDGVPGEVVEDDDQLPEMLEQIYMGGLVDDDINELPDSFEGEDVQNYEKLFNDAQRKVDDVEVEIIRQSVVEDVNDDDLICADGDGLMGETADEEEDDFDTSVDVDS
ncbi:hypothetical protein U1Q18_032364, partial [Sarracenia purpurea var. burkii]